MTIKSSFSCDILEDVRSELLASANDVGKRLYSLFSTYARTDFPDPAVARVSVKSAVLEDFNVKLTLSVTPEKPR